MTRRACARASIALAALLGGCTLAASYPEVSGEICGNRVDDDLDGRIDCDDAECNGVDPCTSHLSWLEAGEPTAERPRMTCPPGWRVASGEGALETCDPYPEAGPAACDPGFAHFPGDPGCAPIGRACPPGDWPDDLPSSNVVYVRPGGIGDGSRDAPLGTLSDALQRAYPTRGTIALARGTYETPGETLQSVSIRGACAAETVIRAASTIGMGFALFAVPSTASVVLTDVHIDGRGVATGLIVNGDLTLRGVWLTNLVRFGVLGRGGEHPAYLDAHELVLQHIARQLDGGFGIFGDSGCDVRLGRVIVEDTTAAGIAMTGHVGSLEMADTVVRDVHASDGASDGGGIQTDVPTTASAVLIERTHALGLALLGAASIDDLVVRDVVGSADGTGTGILIVSLVTPRLRRVLVERAHGIGVQIQGPGSGAFEDLVVRDTLAVSTGGRLGRSLVATGAVVRGERVWIEGGHELGVFATHGSRVSLVDLTVHSPSGVGIGCDHASALDLSRVIVDTSVGAGILTLGHGSTLTAEDVLVRDTVAVADGTLGYGVAVQDHAFAVADHLLVDGSDSVGVLVHGERATILLTDAVVRRTLAPTCGPACGGGAGIGAYEGADVVLHRIVVDEAPACGVDLTERAALELTSGSIRAVRAGICASASSADLERIRQGFAYVGEGAALTTDVRVAPAPVPTIAP